MAFASPKRGKRFNTRRERLHDQYQLLCRKSGCKPVKMVLDMLKIQTLMLQDARTCALVQLKILHQLLSSGKVILFNIHVAMGNGQFFRRRQSQKFRADQRDELLQLILGTLGKLIRFSLKTVALNGLRLSLSNLRILSNALMFTKTLLALDLQQSHPMGPTRLKVLVQGLQGNSSIQFLSLARCGLDDICGGLMVQLIEAQTSRTAQRKWRKNLRVHFPDDDERRPYVGSDSGLLALDLSGNSLSDATFVPLSDALLDGNLIALNLRTNRPSERGLNGLYRAVKRNKNLVRVMTFEPQVTDSPDATDHIGRLCNKRSLPAKCRTVLGPILQHWTTPRDPSPESPSRGADPPRAVAAPTARVIPRDRQVPPSAMSAAQLEQCLAEVRAAFSKAAAFTVSTEEENHSHNGLNKPKLTELRGLEQKLLIALKLAGH